jgi:hypothetical protein
VAAAIIAMPAGWASAQEAGLSGGLLELDAITVTASAPTGEPVIASSPVTLS